jgi:hypothetical protein
MAITPSQRLLGIFLSDAREGGRKPGQFGRSGAAADQLR